MVTVTKLFILLSFCLIFFEPDSLSAQNYNHVGVRMGFNRTHFAPLQESEKSTALYGIVAGVYGRFRIPALGAFVQPELLFAQKSGEYENFAGVKHLRKTQQITLPVFVGVFLWEGRIRLQAGTVLGLVVGNEEKVSFKGTGVSSEIIGLNNTLIGYELGLGYIWRKFEIDLRYGSTFNSITETSNAYKMKSFSLSFAYLIF